MKDENIRRLRVLVLTSTFPRWAGDHQPAFVCELSRRLAEDFDMTVLTPRSVGAKDRETLSGLRVIRFSYFFRPWEKLAMYGGGILHQLRTHRLYYFMVPFFLVGQLLAFIRLLRCESFDLIHAHWMIPQGWIAALGLRITHRKIPLLCTSHGSDLFALRWKFLQNLKKRVLRKSDAITVMSRVMKSKVVDMGIASEKVDVIPMGVDLKNLFTPDSAVKRSTDELLFVGRLAENKGVQYLLNALPLVIRKHPSLRLRIAGSGPMEEALKNQATRLHIAKRVEFLGALTQEELPNLYRRAALAVFPFVVAQSGDQEGFGLVQVEAMGCLCPVISGDVPAIHDILEHGKTGWMVPAGNAEALAETISQALDHPELRATFAQAARNTVVEKFDWNGIVRKYADLYRQLTTDR